VPQKPGATSPSLWPKRRSPPSAACTKPLAPLTHAHAATPNTPLQPGRSLHGGGPSSQTARRGAQRSRIGRGRGRERRRGQQRGWSVAAAARSGALGRWARLRAAAARALLPGPCCPGPAARRPGLAQSWMRRSPRWLRQRAGWAAALPRRQGSSRRDAFEASVKSVIIGAAAGPRGTPRAPPRACRSGANGAGAAAAAAARGLAAVAAKGPTRSTRAAAASGAAGRAAGASVAAAAGLARCCKDGPGLPCSGPATGNEQILCSHVRKPGSGLGAQGSACSPVDCVIPPPVTPAPLPQRWWLRPQSCERGRFRAPTTRWGYGAVPASHQAPASHGRPPLQAGGAMAARPRARRGRGRSTLLSWS
jgi:hypothetical protein